jgi:hypothetical protein
MERPKPNIQGTWKNKQLFGDDEMIFKNLDILIEKYNSLFWKYDELFKKNTFLPIKTAPKDGVKILVYWKEIDNKNPIIAEYLDTLKRWEPVFEYDMHYQGTSPSHWMPLPELPK